MFATIALLTALAAAPQQGHGPEHSTNPGEHAAEAVGGQAHDENQLDIIHHISDAREIELPGGYVWHLPPEHSWQVGPVDLTPTKHVVFLALTALIVLLIFLPTAASSRRTEEGGVRRRRYGILEALVLFLRDQVVMPNIGHGGEKYVPFIATLFFFILVSNLLGLLPWGASATGNISVTAALALLSFVVIEFSGMRALGAKGYLGTIVYIPHGLPKPLIPVMAVIMTPVELLGKIVKPVALAIRLFANMTAGHVLLLAIIGLIFLFGSWAVVVGPFVMAIALTMMELFVGFLQAYIFALLTSVFIGLIRHAH